jgi:hypothetical protein
MRLLLLLGLLPFKERIHRTDKAAREKCARTPLSRFLSCFLSCPLLTNPIPSTSVPVDGVAVQQIPL